MCILRAFAPAYTRRMPKCLILCASYTDYPSAFSHICAFVITYRRVRGDMRFYACTCARLTLCKYAILFRKICPREYVSTPTYPLALHVHPYPHVALHTYTPTPNACTHITRGSVANSFSLQIDLMFYVCSLY